LDFYTEFTNRMTIMQDGFIGINIVATNNPLAQLHVVKGTTTGAVDGYNGYPAIFADVSSGDGLYVYDTDGGGYGVYVGNADYGVNAFGNSVGVQGTSTSGTGVYASSSSGSALTIGSGAFHVSGASTNSLTAAFTQVAVSTNISSATTFIYNPQCDGDPNAILIVTPNYSPHGGYSGYWNHPVGVYYNGAHWGIFNEDTTVMPAGPAFNVLIIKN
jgi:hypothetical protein